MDLASTDEPFEEGSDLLESDSKFPLHGVPARSSSSFLSPASGLGLAHPAPTMTSASS